MKSVLYRPIYYTWLAFMGALLVGLSVWVVGSMLGLPGIFDDGYTEFPSPLFMVLVCSAGFAVVVFVGTFLAKPGLPVLAILGVVIGIPVLIILLRWLLETWGSKMILIAVPVPIGLFTGVQLMLFIRKRVEAGVWITFFLVIVFAVLTWWSNFTDSDMLSLAILLYFASLVMLCLGYAAFFVMYTIIVRRRLGV